MPFKHNASRRHHIPKARRRVMNWPAYEAGLRRRGDLMLWLDEAALAGWHAPRRTTRRGQPVYAEVAIELVLTLRLVFQVSGQGEWDAEKHGRTPRQWRKLHLAVDA
ncbi:hypothetical protein HN018_25105 (plasmid) [Lichenicola cladoniae]|uniref:Transposase DDE domain-containing protein n=1 Tax=Lichenicola cladoniae TaxID=1484109 RepID=A0A6M8HZ06_9PROT|nr:transposase [Lichenicola cladoniae]NPD69578.1 hypothetical protein [Acetobacteraceae bacterium]QKE93457.1 hypothetical protein HN018_25105 [Lichenicola cladoniae]